MDVQMPVMGGFEATAEIRRREAETGAHLRVVAMTAHAMSGDRDRCLAAGMDAYVSKPIDPVLLFAVVEHELVGEDAPRARPADDLRPTPALDRQDVLKRVGGDEDLLRELCQLFLEDCPARMAEIKAAVDAGDAEAIRTAAHALKGAAGNLSASGLFEAAKTLERLGAERRLDATRAAWRQLTIEATAVLEALREWSDDSRPDPLRCAS